MLSEEEFRIGTHVTLKAQRLDLCIPEGTVKDINKVGKNLTFVKVKWDNFLICSYNADDLSVIEQHPSLCVSIW